MVRQLHTPHSSCHLTARQGQLTAPSYWPRKHTSTQAAFRNSSFEIGGFFLTCLPGTKAPAQRLLGAELAGNAARRLSVHVRRASLPCPAGPPDASLTKPVAQRAVNSLDRSQQHIHHLVWEPPKCASFSPTGSNQLEAPLAPTTQGGKAEEEQRNNRFASWAHYSLKQQERSWRHRKATGSF